MHVCTHTLGHINVKHTREKLYIHNMKYILVNTTESHIQAHKYSCKACLHADINLHTFTHFKIVLNIVGNVL